MERVTVTEAARRLGITPNAIRQRISRGNMQSDKDAEGRVFVYLDPNEQPHTQVDNELVTELRSRVQHLERELKVREEEIRRRDHLLAAALERIPAIEAPHEDSSPQARESPVTASEDADKGEVPPEAERRGSWWQRFFGFD